MYVELSVLNEWQFLLFEWLVPNFERIPINLLSKKMAEYICLYY